MRLITPSCIKRADERLNCPSCNGCGIKNGKSKAGKQRYVCKYCNKYFLSYYSNRACNIDTNYEIVRFTKEGLGIRSIARVLEISATTLLKRLLQIAQNIQQPAVIRYKTYEVDEMKSFIMSKKKKIWIAYAMARDSGQVVSFNVGARSKRTLKVVVKTLLLSSARKIYTDGWRGYNSLIPWRQHSTWLHGTNHIERKNLSIRIHLMTVFVFPCVCFQIFMALSVPQNAESGVVLPVPATNYTQRMITGNKKRVTLASYPFSCYKIAAKPDGH